MPVNKDRKRNAELQYKFKDNEGPVVAVVKFFLFLISNVIHTSYNFRNIILVFSV